MKMNPTSHRQGAGWTLVELAVVLIVVALLTIIALPLLPLGARMSEEELAARRMQEAEQALLGYALSNFRLPMADIDDDGIEDGGALSGRLPVATLGLSDDTPMAYSVNAFLASPVNAGLYNPSLPALDGQPAPPMLANGLDLCVQLGQLLVPTGGSIPPAFALAHRLPDGAGNSLLTTNLPGTADGAASGLLSTALGTGELYSRLGCTDRLARAWAAAQSARTANSQYRLAEQHVAIRDFYVEIAKLDKQNAKTQVGYAAFDMAFAVVELALGAVAAVPDLAPPDDAFKVTVAITQIAVGTAALGLAIKALVDAADQGVKDADAAYDNAEARQTIARDQLERMKQLRQAATTRAQLLDTYGLEP